MHEGEQLRILLFHMVSMPGAIRDLLFLSRTEMKFRLISREFQEACAVVRNKYAPPIIHLHYDIFYGSTRAALQNHIHARQIDQVIYKKDLQLKSIDKYSINTYPILARIKACEVVDISAQHETEWEPVLFAEANTKEYAAER